MTNKDVYSILSTYRFMCVFAKREPCVRQKLLFHSNSLVIAILMQGHTTVSKMANDAVVCVPVTHSL